MSMDWGPPNYIPEWQDLNRTQYHPQESITHEIAWEPGMSWRFLDTTGFKVFAVLGMTWVAFVCFEAYHSKPNRSYAHHPSHLTTPRHTHRKD